MKRIIQAVVVAALFTSVQAKAEDEAIVLPSEWTYADKHAAEIASNPVVSAFAGSARDDGITLEAMSTYADRHVAEIASEPVVSAFAGNARDEGITLEPSVTYADQFVTERNLQASAAADPALSE